MPTHAHRADDRPRLRPVAQQEREDEAAFDSTTDKQPALLLTVAQAAQRLGIGRSLLYELMAAGELHSIHVRRLRRIPRRRDRRLHHAAAPQSSTVRRGSTNYPE